jgi:hypothetical protein
MRRESFSPIVEEQRPRKVRGKLLVWCGVATVAAAAAVGTVYLFVVSGTFTASFVFPDMKLASSSALFKELVAERMAEHPFLRFLGADSVLFWRGSGTVHLLAALSPAVADVTVDVQLAERRVSFSVTERPIVGVWCFPGRGGEPSRGETAASSAAPTVTGHEPSPTCYGFDDDGVLFTDVPDVSGSLILKVMDENQDLPVLGQRVLLKREWYDRFRETLAAIDENGRAIVAVRVRDAGIREWEVTLAEGTVLHFSFEFVPENLGSVLRSLGERLKFESLSYIDFRIPNRVYYK